MKQSGAYKDTRKSSKKANILFTDIVDNVNLLWWFANDADISTNRNVEKNIDFYMEYYFYKIFHQYN